MWSFHYSWSDFRSYSKVSYSLFSSLWCSSSSKVNQSNHFNSKCKETQNLTKEFVSMKRWIVASVNGVEFERISKNTKKNVSLRIFSAIWSVNGMEFVRNFQITWMSVLMQILSVCKWIKVAIGVEWEKNWKNTQMFAHSWNWIVWHWMLAVIGKEW